MKNPEHLSAYVGSQSTLAQLVMCKTQLVSSYTLS